MEIALIGVLFIGLDRRSPGIVVNAAVGLGVARLPGLLERDYNLPMDAGLSLWITAAAFFHAVGTVGVPGTSASFYQGIWWWDHFTHALSASVVAGAGYTVVSAIDAHDDRVHLTPTFTFGFVLLTVMAFGVAWEVLEFALGGLAAQTGTRILTQYGVDDTMLDLVFDLVGAALVATVGTAHLSGVVDAFTQSLADR